MSLLTVQLGGTLQSYAGGRKTFQVEAGNIREMLTRLGEQVPALKAALDRGVAVAVDGQIIREAWFHPLRPENEIFLLPKLAGG